MRQTGGRQWPLENNIESNAMTQSDIEPDNSPNGRIDAMEELIAHHENTIEDLSAQLANQWATITDMESKLLVLTKRFVSLEEASLPAVEITKPPHY